MWSLRNTFILQTRNYIQFIFVHTSLYLVLVVKNQHNQCTTVWYLWSNSYNALISGFTLLCLVLWKCKIYIHHQLWIQMLDCICNFIHGYLSFRHIKMTKVPTNKRRGFIGFKIHLLFSSKICFLCFIQITLPMFHWNTFPIFQMKQWIKGRH